jgi:hypothetical protein
MAVSNRINRLYELEINIVDLLFNYSRLQPKADQPLAENPFPSLIRRGLRGGCCGLNT